MILFSRRIRKLVGWSLAVCLATAMLTVNLPVSPVHAAQMFEDDFEDGYADGWTAVYGSWSVVADGSNVYKQASGNGEGLAVAGNANWTDYAVEASIKVYDMDSTDATGIVARYQDADNYYLFRLHQSGKAQLYKKQAGTFTLLQESPQSFQINTVYRLKLVLQGSTLTGYVNGVQKVSVTDATFASGKIGARSYNQSFSLDDVAVTDLVSSLPETSTNVALNRPATASSTYSDYTADKAVDGVISDESRWVSANVNSTHTLEIDLGSDYELLCAHVHSGWKDQDPVANFTLQYWNGSDWADLASVANNTSLDLRVDFPSAPFVTSDKIRLVSDDDGHIRIKEIKIFNNSVGGCPPLDATPTDPSPSLPPETDIFVNLSGYNTGKPKRFTAPALADGTPFDIVPAGGSTVLYSGTIAGHIGDFSDFNPPVPGEYVIRAAGKESYPFMIAPNWLERVSYQNAVDFMIDSRCYVGTDNSCVAGVAWRDAHQFSFEVQSLVEQFFSNPSTYERMPRQVQYVPGYGELNAFDPDAPDIVKLIHWAVDRYMATDVNHTLFKEQLAYFLYAYPEMKDYISEEDYRAVLDYTFNLWGNPDKSRYSWYDISHTADLFQTYTRIGDGKGQFPPGHSIIPNLMMYEVAMREGRADAQRYFDAAYNNAAWIIQHLDWNDPQTTKGQRMSERITIQALAYFQKEYPDQAPPGLLEKIEEWADIVIARSNNMWDFRTYSDTYWVIPDYNEPGNVLGFPAAVYAALQVIGDETKRSRLEQLAISHIDNAFGRNPTGRHFSHDAPVYFEGVETGWYSEYAGGNGRLNAVRAVFDGSPKEAHYPVNVPDAGDVGHTEGWVAFNTAWNSTLAYMAYHDTKVNVFDAAFANELAAFAAGSVIGVQLNAPLNFDYANPEYGDVILTTSNGDRETLRVYETSANSPDFRNTVRITVGDAEPGDGEAQVPAGGWLEISYGFGMFKHSVTFVENNGQFVRQ